MKGSNGSFGDTAQDKRRRSFDRDYSEQVSDFFRLLVWEEGRGKVLRFTEKACCMGKDAEVRVVITFRSS
jgi:hypothetical protein